MSSAITRRGMFAAAAWLGPHRLGSAASCEEPPAPTRAAPPPDVGLGRLNAQVDWGAAIGAPALHDPNFLRVLEAERPRVLAIANALKFGHVFPQAPPVEGIEAAAQWSECDDIYALAARWRTPLRADCLAWNDWLPPWLTALAAAKERGWRDRARTLYDAHFRAVFTHFATLERGVATPLVRWYGLVNEPLDPWAIMRGAPPWRGGVWLDALGTGADGVPAYIHRAFELTERFGRPGVKNFVNETNCDNDRMGPHARPALLRLVDSLQTAGRRIDAVGLESHLMPQWMADPRRPDWRPFVAFLRDLSRRGVEIYLTEVDVIDCAADSVETRDRLVADTLHSFISAALEIPAVKMVTNWDMSDNYSWWRDDTVYRSLPNWAGCPATPPCPRPTPYDQALRPKPARRALADALASQRQPNP